jgi:hypothetical protein
MASDSRFPLKRTHEGADVGDGPLSTCPVTAAYHRRPCNVSWLHVLGAGGFGNPGYSEHILSTVKESMGAELFDTVGETTSRQH